jgi:large subunit ribosomal protein L21e
MPAGHGLRSRCRDLVSKGYRQNGTIPLTDLLRVFKTGDYVDIKINSAVHAGMPHKWYHGKTGIIWNVTKRSVGVEVNKQVRPDAAACAPRARLCGTVTASLQP